MAGTCGKCGEAARYVQTRSGGWWVHDGSGRYQSDKPEKHDVNTHIQLRSVN